jgi:hypothetical protein
MLTASLDAPSRKRSRGTRTIDQEMIEAQATPIAAARNTTW